MKKIIYNNDNLTEKDINKYVKRAKIVIENSNNEILIVYSHNNYFLIGGHVDDNESFYECLNREIKEETGVTIPIEKTEPFISIEYLNKDYPNKGENTKYINNYYYIKYDLIPNINNTNLTEDEKDGNFKIEYIDKDKIIDILTKSLETATRENVVKDTIEVLKEYLKN